MRGGGTTQGSAIYVGNTDNDDKQLLLGQWGASSYIYNKAAGNLGLGTADLLRLTIDGTGNVGIGIDTPTALLEVGGDADSIGLIGRSQIGFIGHSDYAGFAHRDKAGSVDFALAQGPAGDTLSLIHI